MSATRDPVGRAVLRALIALGQPEECQVNIGEVLRHVQQADSDISAEQVSGILAQFDDACIVALDGPNYLNSSAIEVRGSQTIRWISPVVFEAVI